MAMPEERWMWFGHRAIGAFHLTREHGQWVVSFNGERLRLLPDLTSAREFVRSQLGEPAPATPATVDLRSAETPRSVTTARA